MTKTQIAGFIIAISLGIGYIVWLDAGCDISGAMTWQGKVCDI